MQETIKEFFIYLQEIGATDYVYTSFHLLSFFVAAPFFLWLGKKMNIGRVRAFFALLTICVVFLGLMLFIGWIEASLGLGNFGRKNAVTIYIWLPIICFGASRITKIEWGTLCTMMAPTMPLIQAASRPGCLFAGCCKGFECSWGIYNIHAKNFRFPMPVFEMLWMLGIALLVLYLLKRQNYKPTRWLFPLMLVVFGGIQFVSEFYIDNAKIWGSWSLRSFHEVSMIVVGLIWIFIIYLKWTKEQERKNRFKKPQKNRG